MNQNLFVRRSRLALAGLLIGLIASLGCETKPQVSTNATPRPKMKRLQDAKAKAALAKP